METMKLRAIQHPGHAGELLDSFIRNAGRPAPDRIELTRGRDLTPTLEKVAQRWIEECSVWQAWTDDRAIWLWACEVSLTRSRERGMPVMAVTRYDESGASRGQRYWVRVREDNWQRCNE